MAFGEPAPQQQSAGAASGERWELRNLTILEGQPKQTSKGKVYWRVKDQKNFWYSVWEDAVKITLETAQESGQPIDCAVQIKPGRDGGNPFYTIVVAGAAAAQVVEQGSAKAAASTAPGGKNSEFQRRMHPDDALRVTYLNLFQHAERMAEFTADERPEGTSKEQWLKAKMPEYANFLAALVKMPKTMPDAPAETPAPTEEKPAPASPPPVEDYPYTDDDIPL